MSKNVPLRIQTVFMADALNYPTCRVLFSCTNTGRNTNSLTQPFPPPSLTEHLTDLPRKIPSKRISPLDGPPFCLWIKRKFPRLKKLIKQLGFTVSNQPIQSSTRAHTLFARLSDSSESGGMGRQRRECVGQDMEVFDATVRRRGRVA